MLSTRPATAMPLAVDFIPVRLFTIPRMENTMPTGKATAPRTLSRPNTKAMVAFPVGLCTATGTGPPA